ncbi:MAG: cation diffusion facilitator family transporter [Methanoregula sp.]|jgi:cation diffusion facilitator family transporter|uniref:cation diffusion facilitator family transporter n=1 Tax=Methanoregula sp. TaxID=2052170 RepID=UPI0025D91FBC|nr:cation diffusion facilitator family transporter [Methanoregula sp.]MCK9630881.1 cation diffusion facilitator family transporter [Methanoregula sp.]
MSHACATDESDGGSFATKQRTVLVSLIVDFVLWIPDIIAAMLSGSIVLFADALKCANEILATFFAYLTLCKMAKGGAGSYDYGLGKFETITSIVTGAVMFVSLALVFFVAVYRIVIPAELVHEGAYLGIVLMIIGVCMNSWLWRKNYRLFQKEPSPIIDSQWRLFRTKAFSDFSVLVSLIATLAFSHYAWSLYIDPLASFIIAGFLLTSGYRVITSSLPDLLDKTLDEELQMVIVRHLAEFFDDYTALHGVRSRRSGANVYIEIFLEFDGNRKMSDVQESINRIRASLEKNIPKSSVSIVPTDGLVPGGTPCPSPAPDRKL